ncbi:MAG: hypothetical protein RL660_34 [Bacteroidota bacterium]|jgi:hypothetical protein
MLARRKIQYYLVGLVVICLGSCYFYKAGNRPKRLDLEVCTPFNPFFVREYAYTFDSLSQTDYPLNSDIINFPREYFALTDSACSVKYLFKHQICNRDTVGCRESRFLITSVLDFKQNKAIDNFDSFKAHYSDKLIKFLNIHLLPQIKSTYSKVHDTVLYEASNCVEFSIDALNVKKP